MLSFHVADDRLDGGPTRQLAFYIVARNLARDVRMTRLFNALTARISAMPNLPVRADASNLCPAAQTEAAHILSR
jgi:hypothetical protein